ncbi:MAG: nuclear transport factor 2 family protein [Steroidobacteraceae bacterium]
MKTNLSVYCVSVVAAWLVGCSQGSPPPAPPAIDAPPAFDLAAARTVIEANNARFTQAHVTGDQATIDAMFTADARSLPPGSEPVIGRDAISKLTSDYLAAGVHEFTEETTDFYGDASLLVDQGNYRMVYGKDKVVETGKYLNVWVQEGGAWKIRTNVWNTNAAPAN